MKIRNTLIAFVVLLALGGALYYLRKQPQKESSGATPKQKLFSFTADQVQEFTLEGKDQPAATFRRKAAAPQPPLESKPGGAPPAAGAAQWEIVAPAGVAADHEQIKSFLEGLPGLEGAPLDSQTPQSLPEYGLDQPQKVFKFQLRQGQPVTLSLGKENPSGYARYGLLSTSPAVYLLDSYDTKPLEKTLFDLRDKRVLPVDLNQAQRVDLHFDLGANPPSAEEMQKARELGLPVKRPHIGFTRQPNGNWQLTDPQVRTDYGNSNYLISMITGGMMQAVAAESATSLSAYGLDRPSIRLEVATPSGTQSLLVGKKEPEKKPETKEGSPSTSSGVTGYYAKNSLWPHVFTINQILYDQLNQELEGYRNRFLFDFDTANARRVEILGPQGEMRFDKKGDTWARSDPGAKVDSAKVDDFLNSIHSTRVQHYTADDAGRLAQYGLNSPWLKIKVTFGEQNKEETVLFAKKNNHFYAARQGENSVYELGSTEPENLEAKLKELKS